MSNKDMARVVIQMETEVGRLRKDWAKVEKIVQGSANNMQRSSARAAQKMQRDMTNATKNMGSAFKGVEGQLQSFAGRLGPVGAGMGALGPAGLAAAAGIGALVIGLGKGMTSAAESERVFKRLEAVLKLAGNAAGLSAKDIDGFAGNLERTTGIAKNEINAAAAALATYTNISGERFKEIIRLSTDMVAVYGGNLREWADKIARAIDDPIQGFAALKRAGFQLTDAQLDLVEGMRKVGDIAGYQQQMITILSDSLGGAAGAQNKGLSGAAGRAQAAVGAFFEEMARWTGIGPATEKVLNGIAGGLEHVAETAERMRALEIDVGFNVVKLNREIAEIEDKIANIKSGKEGVVPEIGASWIADLEARKRELEADMNRWIERGQKEVAEMASVQIGERLGQWGAATDLIKDNAKAAEDAAKTYQTTQERLTALNTTYADTQGKIEQARELWKASAADLRTMTAEEQAAYEARGKAIEEWAAAEEDAHRRASASIQQQIANEAKRAAREAGRQNAYQRLSERIVEATAVMVAETEVQRQLNPLVDDYGYAVEKARLEQELLNAAKEAGVAVTPKLRQEMSDLAGQYAIASVEARQLAEEQEKIKQSAEDMANFQKDLFRGIVDGFIEGKSAADIFSNALKKIADQLLTMAFNDLFSSGGGGGPLGFIGKLFGLKDGGSVDVQKHAPRIMRLAGGGKVSGPGTGTSDSIPAMLSDGEYVVKAKAAAKHRALLDAINQDKIAAYAKGGSVRVPHFAGGGAVSMPSIPNIQPPRMPSLTSMGRAGGGNVTVDARTTIHAPNADREGLARLEGMIRKRDAELPGRVVAAVRDAQRRNVNF